MINVLANDGMHASGVRMLEDAGIRVNTQTFPQEALPDVLREYDALVVRSATKVRQPLIDACPNLKFIGRGGVGMDNIDVEYARSKGIGVFNTPASSSESVAELVMGHLYSMARGLYHTNRHMPGADAEQFKAMKKAFGKGMELRGATLGIVGCGRIGTALARLALGAGMKVIPHRPDQDTIELSLEISGLDPVPVVLPVQSLEETLRQADFVSLNLSWGKDDPPLMDASHFAMMKKGACLVNAARGALLSEPDLIAALDSGHLACAALDVFEGEPSPSQAITRHPKISLSPHIGAGTAAAQGRIGLEMAGHILQFFGVEAAKA
jgi:D-3-phosphoglycerate dehydrogenase / 2-oxoglutarate reductase